MDISPRLEGVVLAREVFTSDLILPRDHWSTMTHYCFNLELVFPFAGAAVHLQPIMLGEDRS